MMPIDFFLTGVIVGYLAGTVARIVWTYRR